jgi:hypothetical protein
VEEKIMAFGGYKFAGYRVDNEQYSTSIERCLAIHAERVRAFLNASNAAGNPWVVDPEWSIGTIDLNVTTGVISTGTNCIIIEQIGDDGNVHGYLTCFKYSNGGVNGYYAILTTDDYYFGSGTGTGLSLNPDGCMRQKWGSYDTAGGPYLASCLHCLSLEPFTHAPSSETGKDCYYLVSLHQKSTTIKSIGYNGVIQGISSYAQCAGGFVDLTESITFYGYAIKDKDIIVFSSYSDKASYTNPFTGFDNTHVTVLSLEGFSELYSKDDTYKFLEFEVKNGTNEDSGRTEIESNSFRGAHDQFLDANGNRMIDSNYNTTNKSMIPLDARAMYDAPGANYAPFMGIPFFIMNYVSGTQYFKGTTNPEFVSTNLSMQALTYSNYSPVIDGSLLYVYSLTISQSYSNGTIPIWSPYTNSSGYNSKFSNSGIDGYYNVYIGWDSSNPDIKTDAAWPEYNPSVSSLVV